MVPMADNHEQQHGQDFPAVTSPSEAVAPNDETEAPSMKTTSADMLEQNAPWTRSRENRASEHDGGEAPVRNIGSGPSPLHPHAYPGRLGKKFQADSRRNNESGSALGVSAPGKARPDKSALLPKFGAWDVNDPASGEGYTIIFDKARDEKKTGGVARTPATRADSPLATKSGGDSEKIHSSCQESSRLTWLCCCFHQNGTK